MGKIVYIKITEGCQLNCGHCFTGGNGPDIEFLDVDKTVQWAKKFSEIEDRHIHFELLGGEPMLAPVDSLNALVVGLRQITGPRVSIGMTTNLVYKLTDERLLFIKSLDSIGTSWDKDIRFANEAQYELWQHNLKVMQTWQVPYTINVSLTRGVIEMCQKTLLKTLKDFKPRRVMFERITLNGNAANLPSIVPNNTDIDEWYLRHHKASEELLARKWFTNAAFEAIYEKFETGTLNCGTFCRDCEQKIFTLNADGTIAGCPNGAQTEHYSDITKTINQTLNSPKRIDLIVKEKVRSDVCYGCPVYSVCGGDCHRISWQGDQCASPKSLMMHLSGMEVLTYKTTLKNRFIPIKEVR